MSRILMLMLLGGAALLGGCYEEPVAIATFPPTDSPAPTSQPTESPSPDPTATVSPAPPRTPPVSPTPSPTPSRAAQGSAAIGSPASDCVNGWTRPIPGSPEHTDVITMLAERMDYEIGYTIDEMRYFTGPEVPWILEPEFDQVERWYVKASFDGGADLRGRWLFERRTEQIYGVSAVAPYSSTGYESPDWTGFVGEGPPTNYLGLPGQWSGIPYDFVTGEGDSGNPGLPDEVVGCMTGT